MIEPLPFFPLRCLSIASLFLDSPVSLLAGQETFIISPRSSQTLPVEDTHMEDVQTTTTVCRPLLRCTSFSGAHHLFLACSNHGRGPQRELRPCQTKAGRPDVSSIGQRCDPVATHWCGSPEAPKQLGECCPSNGTSIRVHRYRRSTRNCDGIGVETGYMSRLNRERKAPRGRR
jgi:hypothetical protein